jgi:NAD-dependent deacetylase
MQEQLQRVRDGEADPPCPACGGIQRSATVAFGQSLDPDVVRAAVDASVHCDLFLAVGTSLTVSPASNLPVIASRAGARVIVVNAEPTAFDERADAVVRGQIGELLPSLVLP